MALLLQFEAIVLFWGNSHGLWWLIAALTITAAVLVRMGVKIFNRDALLGQDIDQIRFGWMWRVYWNRLTGRTATRRFPGVGNWFRNLFSFLPELRHPSGILLISLIGGLILGVLLTRLYPLPEELSSTIRAEDFATNMANMSDRLDQLPRMIFWQNFRVIAIGALLGIFTLGVTDVILFMLPWTLIGYLGAQVAASGENALLFVIAVVLPHAIFELPALLLAGAAALRWHATALSPPPERSMGESWLIASADFVRVTVALVIPLLILAAFVEAYITPRIVIWVYGS
jgi:stage II sporulation protein M